MRPAGLERPTNRGVMEPGQLLDLAKRFPAHVDGFLNFSEVVSHWPEVVTLS